MSKDQDPEEYTLDFFFRLVNIDYYIYFQVDDTIQSVAATHKKLRGSRAVLRPLSAMSEHVRALANTIHTK
jgi:hypothetical protein